MSFDYQTNVDSYAVADSTALIRKVYAWMCMALAITGLTAVFTASTPFMLNLIFSYQAVFFVMLLLELGIVVFLVSRINKMSFSAAMGWFIAYSVINGLTLSVIFLAYTASSVAGTFFITAGMFGAMSLIGYTTKKDLSSWGNIFMMLLVGLIIASLVNIFLKSDTMGWIISIVGVIVFTGLTAYDTQKIKRMLNGAQTSEQTKKVALLGALSLYLDFVNLFLYLLRFLGNRR